MHTHFDDFSTLKDLQRGYNDERSSVTTAQTERKVDAASAANYNKIKSIQTQLQAKFVDTAPNPAPPTGLRRQVRHEIKHKQTTLQRLVIGMSEDWWLCVGIMLFSKAVFRTCKV